MWTIVRCRRGVAAMLALFSCLPVPARAEKLPTTIYTTGQGLAHNNVQKVVADSRGFIWFATREGLSRFDGYAFTNYGADEGLPGGAVNDILETRDGVYLIATSGGLARLEANARRRPGTSSEDRRRALFSVHQLSADPASRHVLALYEDSQGRVWIGTRAGLFAADTVSGEMTFRPVALGPRQPTHSPWVLSIHEDRFGTIWISTPPLVRRLWPDGRIDTLDANGDVQVMLEDQAGHLWLGTRQNGLLELTFEEPSGVVATRKAYNTTRGLPTDWINTLFEPREGELWAGAPGGVIEIVTTAAAGKPGIRLLSEAHGLGRGGVQSIAADRSGNLWLGTSAGAVKITRSGFSSFGAADGVTWGTSLVQTRSGDLCFASGMNSGWGLYCFNGTSFEPIPFGLTAGAGTMSWGWNRLVVEARTGGWWLATRGGVARFGNLPRPHDLKGRRPEAWFTQRDGLEAPVILALLEDSRGDIWMAGVVEGAGSRLSRWERHTGVFRHYTTEQNLPDVNSHFAGVLAEDRAGNVWIGFSGAGGVARYQNGAFDRLDSRDQFPAAVRDIFLDSTGRLWIASLRGLVRIDDPAAVSPVFRRYTTRDGLSSNETTAVVEDTSGRLYVATARGIDRVDPATGRIKHFSSSDGWPLAETTSAVLDRRTGHLWFAQATGVVRLVPPDDPPPASPPILITSLEVASEQQPLQPLGERTVPALELGHDRNHLRIEFVALGYASGEDLRYQYRLEGAADDWSAPSSQRVVTLANVAPGAYRFAVRAVNADGILSAEPATVAFTIVPPVWRRSWFLALSVGAALALLYAIYRSRLARAVEIATMRTRIATDLHDDIGANLTKIAILSEVTRQEVARSQEADDRLSAIARISRESVASMSDVVWAINPKRDTLRDTVRRMRQHAEDVCTARGIDLKFHAAAGDQDRRMPIDVRRDVFLIFKEALNNALRHSRCRTLTIDVNADDSGLCLRLIDDGIGFETGMEPSGNGLASMRRRASRIGAMLEILTAPGRGTTVSLSAPSSPARRLRHPA